MLSTTRPSSWRTISSSDDKHVTAYFRTAFVPHYPVRALFLRVLYDDGFAFYVVGVEGGRVGLPAGELTPTTLAAGHEAEVGLACRIPSVAP